MLARVPVGGIQQALRIIVFEAGRNADEIVVPGDAFLKDRLLLSIQAETAGPMRRQFSVERNFLEQCGLVVGLQALFNGVEIDFQRLVARQEVRFQKLRADLIAGPDDGIAAGLHRRRQVQLLGIAEQVAVVPGGGEVDPEIGGVGNAEIHRMQRPLGQIERDRQLSLWIQRRCRFRPDDRKYAYR